VIRNEADIVVTAAAAVLACVAGASGAPVAVTAVLGLVLLAAPGYLLGQLLFGFRLDGLERVVICAGLSLCVPIFGGLIIFAFSIPLHRLTWYALLAGVTLAGDFLLYLRRRSGGTASFSWPVGVRPPVRQIVLYGASVVVAAGALVLAREGVAIQHNPGFTQLWLAPPNGKATTADLGVGNFQGKTTRYRLVLVRNGHVATSWTITLANGHTWQQSPAFTDRGTMSANLYRLPDLIHPYRHVSIGPGGVTS
jgi:hypothetical protein